MRRGATGFTLAELLLSIGLVGLLTASIAGLFGLLRHTLRNVTNSLDQRQQMRAALKQISDDTILAEWVWGSPGTKPECEPANPKAGIPEAYCEFSFFVTQPGWGSTWPHSLESMTPLQIWYRVRGDTLIREVTDPGDRRVVYTTSIVLTGLVPFNGNDNSTIPCDCSRFTYPNGNLVQIELRMAGEPGGQKDVTASSLLHIRG